MGKTNDTVLMSILKFVGPTIPAAAFTVGVYSSQLKSDKKELSDRIDNVQVASKADLQLRDQKYETLEKRVVSLETLARESVATSQDILRELTALRVASQYQNKTLDELRTQLRGQK